MSVLTTEESVAIGRSLATDYFLIKERLSAHELDVLARTRRFVEEDVLPIINGYWERAEFPFELLPKLAELGTIGSGIDGYGCPQLSPMAAGLVAYELSRGDGSVATFHGVHSGLAMKAIDVLGSDEQKQRLLPGMARLEKIGCFALTEPEHGSDSVMLEASARRDGDEWVLNGEKKWIGNATIADVACVFARDEADGHVKGFIVEKGTPGYETTVIEGKLALRSVWNAHIRLTDCRVAEANRLSACNGFRDVTKVLTATRLGVAYAAAGHAVACYDIALRYAQERKQFGKPLASFQLVQSKLVTMLGDVTAMQLYCARLGQLIDEGKATDTIAALAKYFCTVKARGVCLTAREVLGGNGILLDYHIVRHLADMEALYTYEGTADIQTLLVGRDITGVSAVV